MVFGMVLLAFGICPPFPPLLAVGIGVTLVVLIVAIVPRFYAHQAWGVWHEVGLLYGAILTNMMVFFVGFLDATPLDFYGKLIMDSIAVVLMIWLAMSLRSQVIEAANLENSHP